MLLLLLCAAAVRRAAGGCGQNSYGQSGDLDMRRWRLGATPSPVTARRDRAFSRYTFNVTDGSETFPLFYGMTEGYPWSQPIDGARYDALHAATKLRAGDVTVAGYPKTGTTWVEQIVLLLLHGSGVAQRLDPASRNTYDPRKKNIGCVWLEPMLAGKRGPRPGFSIEHFDAMPAPRVIKSHAPFGSLLGTRSGEGTGLDVLKASGSKVVYVSRNPKDAAVSLYFQRAPVPNARRAPKAKTRRGRGPLAGRPPGAKEARPQTARGLKVGLDLRPPAPPSAPAGGTRPLPRRPGPPKRRGRSPAPAAARAQQGRRRLAPAPPTRRTPMDAWCSLYLAGYMASGSFFEHVARWHAAARAPGSPVLFVKYEALKADPTKVVRRIASHLGLQRDDAEIAAVVRLSSFDAMKAASASSSAAAASDARNPKYAVAPGSNASDPTHTTGHIRQGRAGAWVQHFSKTLSDQFDAHYARQMDAFARAAAADFGVPVEVPTFDFGNGCVK